MENLQHQFNRYFVDNGATEWWLTGLKTTLLVTVIALCIGVVLGLLIALIRSTHEQTGKLKLLNIVARVYLTIITISMKKIIVWSESSTEEYSALVSRCVSVSETPSLPTGQSILRM